MGGDVERVAVEATEVVASASGGGVFGGGNGGRSGPSDAASQADEAVGAVALTSSAPASCRRGFKKPHGCDAEILRLVGRTAEGWVS